MSNIYTGVVTYTAQTREYDWGLRTFVGITPTDSNTPGQNDKGIVNVYKDATKPEARYMESMQVGDEVTMIWTQGVGGKRGYFSFDIPRNFVAPQQSASPATQTRTTDSVPRQRQSTGRVYESINTQTARAAIEDALALLDHAMGEALTLFPDVPVEVVQKLAVTAFINGVDHSKESLASSAGIEPDESPADDHSEFLLHVYDKDDKVMSVLAYIAGQFGIYETVNDVIVDLKAMGLSSEDITDDPKTWTRIWNIVSKYDNLLATPTYTVEKARREVMNDIDLFPVFDEEDDDGTLPF